MAFILFPSLQAVCIIMKIGIMILGCLPEGNGTREIFPFPPSYDCKVGLIDRYFAPFLSPVNSARLDK